MNKQFFINNRKKMMDTIEDNSMVLLFAGSLQYRSEDSEYNFFINRNFYYNTGIDREKVIYMGVKSNGKVEETLFIEKPDSYKEAWLGEMLKDDEAKEISGVDGIKYLESFESAVNRSIMCNDLQNLYLDIANNQWDQPLNAAQSFAGEIKSKFPHLAIRNIYHSICKFRLIKTQEEIELIKKAIYITGEGIKNMMKNAHPGMMEYELEAYYDFALKSRGVREPAFPSIIGSGVNGAVLHYSSNNCVADDNSLVLCDVGAEYEKYSADITRTFPVNGRFTDRQRQIYNIVLEANLEVINSMKPGASPRSANETAKKVLAKGCKSIGLIKEDSELSKYYFHGVSHSLGLDTHDVGELYPEFKPGMVFTVEPGLYLKEEGIGVRIEDDVMITEKGCEVLSKDIIKTAEDIEAFMSR